MHYVDELNHLRVEIAPKQCPIPDDEMARMQRSLKPLAEAVRDFAGADLRVALIHHPRSQTFHVAGKLKLPGQTLFTNDQDAYLDSAFQRCIAKLVQGVAAYHERPDRQAQALAERRSALERDIVAPEDPDVGPLSEAARAGDYKRFRTALVLYEDWLRKRIGRWVQRYPEAQGQVGDGLLLGDLVEGVFLNAFEGFARRPTELRLGEWLNGLIDPSLKALLRHPNQERENASMARTLRETPLQ